MIDHENTNFMQIIQKNVNIDKTFNFQEINLDFAFDIYDFNSTPFEHVSE